MVARNQHYRFPSQRNTVRVVEELVVVSVTVSAEVAEHVPALEESDTPLVVNDVVQRNLETPNLSHLYKCTIRYTVKNCHLLSWHAKDVDNSCIV